MAWWKTFYLNLYWRISSKILWRNEYLSVSKFLTNSTKDWRAYYQRLIKTLKHFQLIFSMEVPNLRWKYQLKVYLINNNSNSQRHTIIFISKIQEVNSITFRFHKGRNIWAVLSIGKNLSNLNFEIRNYNFYFWASLKSSFHILLNTTDSAATMNMWIWN